MRVSAAILAVLFGGSVALAQGDPRANPPPVEQPKPEAKKPEPKKEAKPKAKTEASADKPKAEAEAKDDTAAKPKKAAKDTKDTKPASTNGSASTAAPLKPSGLADTYASIPAAERLTLQSDLAWGGDYSGPIDGQFSERLVAAVKAYQTRHKNPATGVLSAEERAALASAVEPRKQAVGWRLMEDTVSGIRVGVPAKFATKITHLQNGTRWSSEQGQLQIETVRIDTGATLEGAFEQQKKIARRRIQSSAQQENTFVISGMQGLKKMVVRGAAKDGEVRILTILYDQAMEGTVDPLVTPITSAFVPFPSGFALAGAADPTHRKIGYGSGLIVSANGHVLTDRNLIDNCNVIAVSGVGNAERIASDVSGEIVLLRIYGARNLTPIGMIGSQPTNGANVTLVGVSDPQAQAGGAAASAVKAGLGPDSSTRRLESAPAPGFSGAAALNERGQLAGMVVMKAPVVAGAGRAAGVAALQAGVVPVDRIRNFLEANYVAPASGKPGVEDAKASVVRVICVRK